VSDQGKYVVKQLKNGTMGFNQSFVTVPNTAFCAAMCSNLYNSEKRYE